MVALFSEELKQDFSRAIHAKSSPLCMETYKNFFNSYRRPGVKIDYQLPKRNEVYPQCIVIVHRKQVLSRSSLLYMLIVFK